jgi:hypothetical protein
MENHSRTLPYRRRIFFIEENLPEIPFFFYRRRGIFPKMSGNSCLTLFKQLYIFI